MAVTIAKVSKAIKDTLSEHPLLDIVHNYDQVEEGIQDTPLVQVYPATGGLYNTTTDRFSMVGNKKVHTRLWTFHVDVYARQRAHIGEDLDILVPLMDAVIDKFEDQNLAPYFGVGAIKAFNYGWEYLTFEYAGSEFVGVRFTVRIYNF